MLMKSPFWKCTFTQLLSEARYGYFHESKVKCTTSFIYLNLNQNQCLNTLNIVYRFFWV